MARVVALVVVEPVVDGADIFSAGDNIWRHKGAAGNRANI
ncbi:uncharacterized protein METZ01_LOCUS370204 [marine metagenome]|uniref:Uncharacterized protein n=1 Tax=marine metagenome TaxID=408172 RepID=A0A382T5C6_9ZZZZ